MRLWRSIVLRQNHVDNVRKENGRVCVLPYVTDSVGGADGMVPRSGSNPHVLSDTTDFKSQNACSCLFPFIRVCADSLVFFT